MKNGISAVLIVKNEEENLPRCLKSLEGVDQIVVHDTGSTDGTVALARSLGADVSVGEPIVPFHFAEARNRADAFATGDWILSMDADEALGRWSLEALREAIGRFPAAEAFITPFVLAVRGGGGARTAKIKLYRRGRWTWKVRVHERLFPVGHPLTDAAWVELYERKGWPGRVEEVPEAVIEHLPLEKKEGRRRQNLELLRLSVKEDPWFVRNFRQLALELFLQGEFDEALGHMVRFEEAVPDADPMEKSETLAYIARCHAGAGRLDEALGWFERSSKAAHFRREPLWYAALALMKVARLHEAQDYLERLLQIPSYLKPGSHVDQDIWGSTVPEEALAFCRAAIADAKARHEAMEGTG